MKIKLKDPEDLKTRIIVRGHTLRSFAKDINMSNPYISQILGGERDPGPKIAKKICDGLGVEFDDIFFITDDNKSYQGQKINSA